jgi:hypothetical protein
VAIGTANVALYAPIFVPEPCVITKLWWQNGATVSGNVDVGVYTEEGTRIVSTGSIAQAGVSNLQTIDITDQALPAGFLYFALGASSATATFWAAVGGAGDNWFTHGGKYQTSVFPLPNTATFGFVNGIALFKYGALVWPRTVL